MLQPGARACITTWGRMENCAQICILRRALESLGKEVPQSILDYHHGFRLSQDLD